MKWVMGALAEVQIQGDEVRKENTDLKNKMDHRQSNNVQQLIKTIEQDMITNKGIIADLNS